MEEEEPLHGSGGGGGGGGSHNISNSITTTIFLPLTRYATRLFTRDHYNLLGDCTELRSDGYDDDDLPSGDCGYSKAFVVLDVIWNLAFVVVSMVVLLSTLQEKPSTPLRVWIGGYALQCLLHVGFVYYECQRRYLDEHVGEDGLSSQSQNSIVKRLESMNTMISSIWWVFGFYWIVMGGQALLQDSPGLYWLAMVFLAFDVCFMVFCIGMACIIFFALVCFVPIVIAIAYAMTIPEGASEDDIRILPKYRFHQANPLRIFDNDKKQEVVGATVESGNINSTSELSLHPEDSECCICLSPYVEGVELYTLPCSHHFHCGCISRWLRINATCPLCKSSILKGDTLV